MAVKKRNRGGSRGGGKEEAPTSSTTNENPRLNAARTITTAQAVPLEAAPRLDQIMDPKDVARVIKAAPVDPSTQIVRHLAIFRMVIFLLLVHAYVKYLPQTEVVPHFMDAWFTYDQFEYLYDWAPKQGDPWGRFYSLTILTVAVFFGMLSVMGGVNGIRHSFRISGTIFLSCFAFRFFMLANNFQDRHYLLWLLGVVTTVSGGGGFFLIFTEAGTGMTEAQQEVLRQKRQILIQSSEWGAVTLRFQYAVVFLYSSLWKLHADYLQGHVLRCQLIGFDDKPNHKSGGLLWSALEAVFGRKIFQLLSIGLFLANFGTFVTMTFRRPTDDNVRSFVVWTTLFHLFVALTMGHKLGYSFSIACLVGILIFQPIGGGSKLASDINSTNSDAQTVIKKRIRSRQYSEEANLLQWVHRYATGSPEARATRHQQLFSLAWLIVQLALPLRMPFISGGEYPFNAKGYRFSWTMMMHTRQTSILHEGKYSSSLAAGDPALTKAVSLQFFYLAPECGGKPLQRRDYMPQYSTSAEDPRSLPMMSILTEQQYSFVTEYPRYVARVGGGMSMLLHQLNPKPCEDTHVSIHAVHFAKLNGKGAFCRMLDPTARLELCEIARWYINWWHTLQFVMFDSKPSVTEVLFSSGVGSMNARIEKHSAFVEKTFQGAQRIEYVADRAICLNGRRLALWLNDYPIVLMALEAPSNTRLYVYSRGLMKSNSSNLTITAGNQLDILHDEKVTALDLQKPIPVSAVSVEIGIHYNEGSELPRRCALSTEEDVLFALVFMS